MLRLPYLEAKRLITVSQEGNSFCLMLTDLVRERAKSLLARPSLAPLVERMCKVKKTFGNKNGTFLKA